MDLKDFNFWAVISYLLPGFILAQAFTFGRDWALKAFSKDDIAQYVLTSALYAFALWTFGYALQTPTSVATLEPRRLIELYVVWPAMAGFIAGTIMRYDALRRVLKAFGIPVPDKERPIRTPWSVVMPTVTKGTYITVIMKNDLSYNVMVTDDTQFSSDPANIDLYFGQTYSVPDWTPNVPQRAVYIRGSEIRAIEIIKP